jgi:hypothetical protein
MHFLISRWAALLGFCLEELSCHYLRVHPTAPDILSSLPRHRHHAAR